MQIESYEDLIMAAISQLEPQRLLFVFAKSELPEGYSEAQQERFFSGDGGVLTPVVCVDKQPMEVFQFNDLVAESENTGFHWDVVFVSAVSDRDGSAVEKADQLLKIMMNNINSGVISAFLTFDRKGEMITLC